MKRAKLRQVADGEGKLVAQRFHRMPRQQDAPGRDRLDAGERLEQRALAAARCADDRNESALGHGEGNIAQQRLVVVALADHERDVLDVNGRLHPGRCFRGWLNVGAHCYCLDVESLSDDAAGDGERISLLTRSIPSLAMTLAG